MDQEKKSLWSKIIQVIITVLTAIGTTLTTQAAIS
ncbi:MAG: smalltalk protein [Parabacteroides sp.]|nr:smalltalk protein [Parabacteroides sp.]MCI7007783.1 smalltalk protein [Parabacteroides sp.]